jgi:hypothetical protein
MLNGHAVVSALPSWRPGPARGAGVDFLDEVTQGPGAVAPTRRVAADSCVFLCIDGSRDVNRVLAGPAYAGIRERAIGPEVRIERLGRGQHG